MFEREMNILNLQQSLPYELATTNHNTQIDTIFTHGIDSDSILSGTHETYFSDHKAIYIGICDANQFPSQSINLIPNPNVKKSMSIIPNERPQVSLTIISIY